MFYKHQTVIFKIIMKKNGVRMSITPAVLRAAKEAHNVNLERQRQACLLGQGGKQIATTYTCPFMMAPWHAPAMVKNLHVQGASHSSQQVSWLRNRSGRRARSAPHHVRLRQERVSNAAGTERRRRWPPTCNHFVKCFGIRCHAPICSSAFYPAPYHENRVPPPFPLTPNLRVLHAGCVSTRVAFSETRHDVL
jgi:hypothetical protein